MGGSPVGSPTLPDEMPRWESYCLYCWTAGIRKDICEAQTRVLPGTSSVDLLGGTEFLVYKLPKMGQGMSDTESMLFADLIGGSYLCGSVLADLLVTQQTTQQARKLHNKREGIKQTNGNINVGIHWNE